MRIALGLLVVLTFAPMAGAEVSPSSANRLLAHCKNFVETQRPSETFASGLCAVNRPWAPITWVRIWKLSFVFCPPSGVTNAQMVRVVVEVLSKSGQLGCMSVRQLATEAMKAAWPCGQ